MKFQRVFPSCVIQGIYKDGVFALDIRYDYLSKTVIKDVTSRLNNWHVEQEDESLILSKSIPGPLEEAKNRHARSLKEIYKLHNELDLEKVIEFLEKPASTINQLDDSLSYDLSMIPLIVQFRQGDSIMDQHKFFRRTGLPTSRPSKYLELMKAENQRRMNEDYRRVFVSENDAQRLSEEARCYFERALAFGTQCMDLDERTTSYRDFERSKMIDDYCLGHVRNNNYVITNSIINAFYYCTTCMELFSAKQYNHGAALRIAERSKTKILGLQDMVNLDGFIGAERWEREKKIGEFVDHKIESLNRMKEIALGEEKNASQYYQRSEFSLEELPLFNRLAFIREHADYIQYAPDVVKEINSVYNSQDYLGFDSDLMFVF